MASLLNTGVSALNAFQRVLTTTGHNIANVNTDGYSRQTVDLAARPPDRQGVAFIGNGVEVTGIRRQYDEFLATRYRQYSASQSGLELYSQRVAMVDNLLGDPATGLSAAFQDYFNAVQDVSADPTSLPARQVMLNEAEQLTARFANIDGWLNDMNRQLNSDFGGFATEVSQLAGSLASLNNPIVEAEGSGAPPNDLLDERDRTLDQLASLVSVTTTAQDNGALNVFIGTGQVLVLDGQAARLVAEVDPADPQTRRLLLVSPGSGAGVAVTEQLTGGRIGGLVEFRNEVLEPARDQLGVLAVAFARESNAVHRQGLDLNGDAGLDLFTEPTAPAAVPLNGGAADVALSFADSGGFQATDYRLAYAAAEGWSVTSARTGEKVVLGPGAGTYAYAGLEITIGGAAPADGDAYQIRPFRNAVSEFGVAVSDPRGIAANGTADPAAVGDSGNALALADLQTGRPLLGGTASFSDVYGSLVAEVGTRARESNDSAAVQASLASQADAARQSISGVNLDEEAANLVRFQQAYQAAAQVISVADTLFETLLGTVRR